MLTLLSFELCLSFPVRFRPQYLRGPGPPKQKENAARKGRSRQSTLELVPRGESSRSRESRSDECVVYTSVTFRFDTRLTHITLPPASRSLSRLSRNPHKVGCRVGAGCAVAREATPQRQRDGYRDGPVGKVSTRGNLMWRRRSGALRHKQFRVSRPKAC